MAEQKQAFAERIQDLRTRRRLTQRQAAHRAAVSERNWGRWEKPDDPTMPNLENLPAIARVLDVTVADLTGQGPEDDIGARLDRMNAYSSRCWTPLRSARINRHAASENEPHPDHRDQAELLLALAAAKDGSG